MPKWPENRVKTPSTFIRLLWFTFNHVSLLSFEPFFRDDIYACIYHFRIRLPKTYCISASYADLSPSKNFFSRHLSPDKTRKSHLDCTGGHEVMQFDTASQNKIQEPRLCGSFSHPWRERRSTRSCLRRRYVCGRTVWVKNIIHLPSSISHLPTAGPTGLCVMDSRWRWRCLPRLPSWSALPRRCSPRGGFWPINAWRCILSFWRIHPSLLGRMGRMSCGTD